MQDLTLESFAYLRLPLMLAAAAFFVGAVGMFALAPAACVPLRRRDDDLVLPGGAAGHGAIRSLLSSQPLEAVLSTLPKGN